MSLAERLSEGFVVFLIGIMVVFSVLMILWAVLAIFKVIFYDIPNKKKAKPVKKEEVKPVAETAAPVIEEDDTEIVAVITAAVASMLGKSESGFKIKSIKRTSKWNKI